MNAMKTKVGIWVVVMLLLLAGCAARVAAPSAQPAAPTPVTAATEVDVQVVVARAFIADQLDSQLTTQLDSLLPNGLELQILDPQLALIPDDSLGLTATLAFRIFGIDLSLRPTVFTALSVVNDELVVDISGVSLGDFALPPALIEPQMAQYQALIQQQIAAIMGQIEETIGLRLLHVLVTEDTLVVDLGR